MNMMLKDPPAETRANFGALERQYSARNYAPFDVVLTRGRGVWVWDVDGRRYLDCLSAYSAVNQGHCHPRILAALTAQASRLAITSRAFMNDQLPLFCQELCDATHSHKVLPMNSGAEAVESAIKVARKWGYEIKGVPQDRAEIVVCANNFHGRRVSSRCVYGRRSTTLFFVPALITAAVSLLLSRRDAAPLAYISGSLGTLIGADLTNLDKVAGLGAPVASIGGAGTFDGIFLTGILAVLLAGLYRPSPPVVQPWA